MTHKRFYSFTAALLLLLLCVACSSGAKPDANSTMQKSNFTFTDGKLSSQALFLKAPDGVSYRYTDENGKQALEKTDSSPTSDVTFAQLQKAAKAVESALSDNLFTMENPGTLQFNPDVQLYAQLSDASGAPAYYVYSLSGAKLTAGSGAYSGDATHGILTFRDSDHVLHTIAIDN